MKDLFIGVDLGTSGIRVEVFDIDGNILAIGRESIQKQDVGTWLEALIRAVPKIVRECMDCEKHLSITSTSGTLLGVDKYGNVVWGPVMYYERFDDFYNTIKEKAVFKDAEYRGLKVDATSPIVKMMYLREVRPDDYLKVKWFISPATYILYRLLFKEGEEWKDVSIDYSNALKFGVDVTSKPPKWIDEIFHELDLDLSKMPSLTDVGSYVGEARSSLSEKAGLFNAKLYQGLTDGTAAAIAGGAIETGDINIYTGSTTVPKIVVEEIKFHPALYYHVHTLKGYLAGSATGFTGAFLSWFTEKVLGLSLSAIDEYAGKAEPGSEFLFYPYGDRAPLNNPHLLPAILGLKISDEDKETISGRFVRSILLGISLLENYYIELFESLFNTKTETINITGGGTKSKIWNEIRASVYGKKVAIFGEMIGSGIVVPLLLKNKFYTSISDVKNRFIRPLEIVSPNKRLESVYNKYKVNFITKWSKLIEFYAIQH